MGKFRTEVIFCVLFSDFITNMDWTDESQIPNCHIFQFHFTQARKLKDLLQKLYDFLFNLEKSETRGKLTNLSSFVLHLMWRLITFLRTTILWHYLSVVLGSQKWTKSLHYIMYIWFVYSQCVYSFSVFEIIIVWLRMVIRSLKHSAMYVHSSKMTFNPFTFSSVCNFSLDHRLTHHCQHVKRTN